MAKREAMQGRMRRSPVVIALVAAVSLPFLFAPLGCITSSVPITYQYRDDFISAEKDFQAERYYLALAKYNGVLRNAPDGPLASECVHRLGQCHLNIGSLQRAQEYFREYLETYPDGKRIESASMYLAEVDERAQAKTKQAQQTLEQVWMRVQANQEAVNNNPDNVQKRMELADAFWDARSYDRSAREYLRAIEIDPAMRENEVLLSRLQFGPYGDVTILTPEELQRRERERNPIEVFNTQAYTGGRDSFSFVRRLYVVTGQVRNRSSRVVYGAGVEVTIYDMLGVLDTRTAFFGTLAPGEVRAFSLGMTNFQDINDVARYECQPLFER